MARKTVGYMELEWVCPQCGTRNKGSQRVCTGCGAAQPTKVAFQQPVQQTLVEDEQKIEQAQAGADIHCAYCGARNPASAAVCVNCGADLTQGAVRQAGQVVGAFKEETEKEVLCPACGAANPASNLRCAQCGVALQTAPTPAETTAQHVPSPVSRPAWLHWAWIPILIVAGVGIIYFVSLLFRQEDAFSVVDRRLWQREMVIEQFGPVQHADWRSDLPDGTTLLDCDQRQRYTANEPVAGATEVCGTPYTVDTGSGYGEVVNDCVYEVYEDYCRYEVDEWSVLDTISSSGENDVPYWPTAQLADQQRTGQQNENYRIVFNLENSTKTYNTSDSQLYEQATLGSQWVLTLNGLGQIIHVEPAQ
jgi:ribosomal protein L40E